MNKELQIFNFKTNEVRTILHENGEIYFCLSDVANILNLGKSSPSRFNLDMDGVHKMSIIDTLSRTQEVNFINEPNLYRVIFRSNKEQAKQFQDWVFNEILPTIRKTGSYGVSLTPKDQCFLDIIKASDELSTTLAVKKLDETIIRPLENKVEEQKDIINQQTPKVEYHDLVLRSKGLLSTSQIAKDYGFSAVKLNKLLNSLGVQYKSNNQWLLYSKYQDKGYVKSETYVNDRGVSIVSTKWTQKGRLFIYDLLKSKDIYPVCEQDGA